MKIKEKYYLECNLDLVLEISEEEREAVIKKLNGIISSTCKGEKVIHIAKSINVTSESDVLLSILGSNLKDIN